MRGTKRKKPTIFRIFLIPLITIMLVQGMITMGTLVMRRTGATLKEYSSNMMIRLVENRGVILQNDMKQRWASIYEQEAFMNDILEQLLKEEYGATDREALLKLSGDEKVRQKLLGQLFGECLRILQNNTTTGTFVILTGKTKEEAGEYDGFFIRDSDPNTNPANFSDLLLERGDKQLAREWNIPLDTHWSSRFHMSGRGNAQGEDYFYEPWRAGEEYGDANAADLGYWSLPFVLEKNGADSYEMITYSVPLKYRGQVYGVLGVEISARYLNYYFPAGELNGLGQSGYLLAVEKEDGRLLPLAGKGLLYERVREADGGISLGETGYGRLSVVENAWFDGQGIYAVAYPLNLYGSHAPYGNTRWTLVGLDTEDDLFGMSRQLYVWVMAAVLLGLGFGVAGIYVLIRHLTRPVEHLARCIGRGRAGLLEFKPSNIFEVDALFDVVNDLTQRQREAENVLLEEKERYRLALEASSDLFFSYDFQTGTLDIVNHKTMSGHWQCEAFGSGFGEHILVFDGDRQRVMEILEAAQDGMSLQFRMKWQEDREFNWVALSGKTVYDTEGSRRKLVGVISDIQEQKELEARQKKRDETDGITGLYSFSAGMERIRQCRGRMQEGVMANLFLNRLRELNEKNGMVFGDLVLEEMGALIRELCQAFEESTGCEAVALRLDGDDFVLWLEGMSESGGQRFIEELLHNIRKDFERDRFSIDVEAGLVSGKRGRTEETLICMARQARNMCKVWGNRAYLFFEQLPSEMTAPLPQLLGREINSLDYSEDISMASLALNLFGRGDDFPAQMMLMIRKIGRYYQAAGVLVSVLQDDFYSNYLEYQWYGDGTNTGETVRKYTKQEKEDFVAWLGQEKARYFSVWDSNLKAVGKFLSVKPGEQGVVLPMYDNGSYMGNLAIIGLGKEVLESGDRYQSLTELSSVIQSQMNQRHSDIASKAKSEFLSRMSHEIRTPMNGIIGMTAIALQKGQSGERILDCLHKIQASSNYLLGLINDILDMSKIESGKMKLDAADFDMEELLDVACEMTGTQAAAREVLLVRDIRLVHRWFVGDRLRLSQVLINLLGNGVKFTPVGGKVTLTVCEDDRDGETVVSFAVRDTGVGIAKEDQERIFGSFEQVSDRNAPARQGTGLGLSISRRLVRMMGGDIRLDSRPGQGSEFGFEIVMKPGQGTEDEGPEEVAESFEGCRVLVVEDNELNAEIAQSLLEERGFRVDCVYDGAQAVERMRIVEPGVYDVILMDIMMPVMNGLDAARAIRGMDREDCKSIPIIAMSANAFDDDLKKSVECGMNGHLSKPVEVDKLYEMLGKVTGKGRRNG